MGERGAEIHFFFSKREEPSKSIEALLQTLKEVNGDVSKVTTRSISEKSRNEYINFDSGFEVDLDGIFSFTAKLLPQEIEFFVGGTDFTSANTINSKEKFLLFIQKLSNRLNNLEAIVGGTRTEFLHYYGSDTPQKFGLRPYIDVYDWLRCQFWMLFVGKDLITKFGEGVFLNAPAWRVIETSNGILILNSLSPADPISENNSTCRDVADYFRKILEAQR